MLKKLRQAQPKQWHRLINPVLFAYREVLQESTGFSPFQLLYGRLVRGPGTILKELWQYEFTRMPFGMVNSGATLVRGLRKILEGMPGVGSYIDDIVIYCDSWEDHLRTLKELFGRLTKARITARPTKCLLGASRMEFLGHQVGGDVITPSRDNPREGPKYSNEIFLGSPRLLQRSYTSLRQNFSTINRPPKERKGRTYPVKS